MVSGNDPIESFLSSFQVVRDAFVPLELGIKKATKDFGPPWWGSKGVRNSNGQLLEEVGMDVKNSKVQMKKKNRHSHHFDEARRKGLLKKLHMKMILGVFLPIGRSDDEYEVDELKEELKEGDFEKEKGSCFNCLPLAMTWPAVFLSQFGKHFQGPFKSGKKQQPCSKSASSHEIKKRETKELVFLMMLPPEEDTTKCNEVKPFGLDLVIGLAFAQLTRHIPQISKGFKQNGEKGAEVSSPPSSPHSHLDPWKAVSGLLEGRKADISMFLGNLKFARVGGMASSTVAAEVTTSPVKEDCDDGLPASSSSNEESETLSPLQKLSGGLLNVPLSNVERLKSTLSNVSITELIELIPQFVRSPNDIPDKKKLFSVQDFFRYTEAEGRRFFEELDRNGDGQVCLEDLEIAMRKRKLPRRYAREFMRRARSHLFAKSFGWKQFLTLMEQKEPTILRAYTSLCLTKSGTLQKSELMTSLKNAGLPANEDTAVAMMRFLNADTQGSISYGHFRNFMLLLPSDRLLDDPRNIWFEAATVVPVAPPAEMPAGSVLRSALAGGLASGLSTSLLHPVDTIKTRVQTSTLSFPEVISRVPEIGVQGLYRGFIPAILGQFTSHGLRTGIFEASKLVLINVAPNLPEIQVQSVASFCSTLLGTATRIPCEVLKQRLQAGLFENVGEAIVGTWRQDGLKGFFRGTGVTLCREVPLYVAGMGLYAESKKLAEHLLRRELDPWETIAVGALSGGIAAVLTTPFDVLKTRMMTAPHGRSISTSMVVISILTQEGPLGFFKGAVPRFFWVAPVGAMNFAGYELAKKAMIKSEEASSDETPEKKNY